MDAERRSQLLFGKLRALTVSHFGDVTLERVAYFAGVAAFDAATQRLFVLVEAAQVDRDPLDIDPLGPRPPRGWLGGAMVAAVRAAATELHLMGDGPLINGEDGRRASRCNIETRCWSVVGRSLVLVEPDPLTNGLADDIASLPPDEQPFVALINATQAVPIVEHGVLRAEVLGLEVGRVQRDPETDQPHLAIGVGKHDRLAQSMMNAAADPITALREAVAAVLVHRRPGAGSHPANTVARSRWLRELVMSSPEKFGFSGPCERISSTVATDLKINGVAHLTAHRDGMAVLIGCVAGVDLDAPGDLLDTAARVDIRDVFLVIPTADLFPAVRVACDTLTPTPGLIPVGSPFSEAD